ncbi:MAG: hypothetical protein J6B60_04910 [Clostridia bacterium]|nr:hypothetical protein [Clostridia bacterium]
MKIIQQTNMTYKQSMGYVIQTKSGHVLAVDGGAIGNEDELERIIKSVGGHVDLWLITHPHDDHHDSVIALLSRNTDITVDRIGSSIISNEWGESLNNAVDARELADWNEFVPSIKDKHFEIKEGQSFQLGSMRIDVLSDTNPDLLNFNDQSRVFRLSEDGFTMLILGDLGSEAGRRLMAKGYDLRADAVQMAHHGQGGVDEAFYQAVNPKYCFWPTPLWLWVNSYAGVVIPDSARFKTPETIEWTRKLGVVNIVSFTHSTSFDSETKKIDKY